VDAFETFLKEHSGNRICTVTPGGNHGDTLIHMGLLKKLDEFGIEYECRNLEEIYGGDALTGAKYILNIAAWRLGLEAGFRLIRIPEGTDLILFEGGGYMNDVWYGPVLLRQVVRRNPQPIAVAPQSYWFNGTDFVALLPVDRYVTLFCRELRSLDLLRGMERLENVSLHVSGDTALYLERRDLEPLIGNAPEPHTLICLREDKESLMDPGRRREIIDGVSDPLVSDISKKGDLSSFVSAVANSKRVHTDRLHVAILAHILGRRATLYSNRYHKNRGVYEYSLRDDPGIDFVDLGGRIA